MFLIVIKLFPSKYRRNYRRNYRLKYQGNYRRKYNGNGNGYLQMTHSGFMSTYGGSVERPRYN